MFLPGVILGLFIGMFLTGCIFINRINQSQLLVNKSRQALINAEGRVVCLIQQNKTLYKENKHIQLEKEKLKDIVNRIYNLSTSNTYNNEKTILTKIKEVITDE